VNKAALFYLRFVTHDLNTEKCIQVLKQIHSAASPTTKLMIVDQLVPYACPVPASSKVEGLQTVPAPKPLLHNLGEATTDVFVMDLTMAVLLDAQERTLVEFNDILGASGWKLERVYQTVGTCLTQFMCVKA